MSLPKEFQDKIQERTRNGQKEAMIYFRKKDGSDSIGCIKTTSDGLSGRDFISNLTPDMLEFETGAIESWDEIEVLTIPNFEDKSE